MMLLYTKSLRDTMAYITYIQDSLVVYYNQVSPYDTKVSQGKPGAINNILAIFYLFVFDFFLLRVTCFLMLVWTNTIKQLNFGKLRQFKLRCPILDMYPFSLILDLKWTLKWQKILFFWKVDTSILESIKKYTIFLFTSSLENQYLLSNRAIDFLYTVWFFA